MKSAILLALAGLTLLGCKKDEATNPNEPHLPIKRYVYATLDDVGADNLTMEIHRATADYSSHLWSNVGGGWHTAIVPDGRPNPVYNNDRLVFIGNVAEAHDVTVRVDDLVTYTLHLDPAQNGQVAGEYTINFAAGIFSSANYCAVGTAGSTTSTGFFTFRGPVNSLPTTTAYRCRVSDSVPNYLDVNHICIAFFGD